MFTKLLLLSRPFYDVFMSNRDRISTQITLDKVLARGIDLSWLSSHPVAYIEYWKESPSPDLEPAIQAIANHKTRKALVLPPPQRTALSSLNALICWKIEEKKYDKAVLKHFVAEYDVGRLWVHDLEESDHGFLCVMDGDMPAFENMKRAWADEAIAKITSEQGYMYIGPPRREEETKEGTTPVSWMSNKLYIKENDRKEHAWRRSDQKEATGILSGMDKGGPSIYRVMGTLEQSRRSCGFEYLCALCACPDYFSTVTISSFISHLQYVKG